MQEGCWEKLGPKKKKKKTTTKTKAIRQEMSKLCGTQYLKIAQEHTLDVELISRCGNENGHQLPW